MQYIRLKAVGFLSSMKEPEHSMIIHLCFTVITTSSPKTDQVAYGNQAHPHIWKSFPFFCLATATAVFSTGLSIWHKLHRLSLEILPHSFLFPLFFALPLEIPSYFLGNSRHRVMQSHVRSCRTTGHFWGLRPAHVLSMWTAQPLWPFPVQYLAKETQPWEIQETELLLLCESWWKITTDTF